MGKTFDVGSKLIVGFVATLSVSAAQAKMTYEGQIIKPDGSPMAGVVNLKIQILSPSPASCLLYEEAFTATASDDGYVSVELTDGSRLDSTSITFSDVFSNKTGVTHSGLTCGSGTTYSPASGDARQMVVYAKESAAGSYEQFPAVAINAVPYSMQASELDGLKPSEIVRVPGQTLSPLTLAVFNAIVAVGDGTSSVWEKYGKINGVTVPAMTTNHVLGWSGSAWQSVDPIAGVQAFAKTALPSCAAGDYIRNNAGALECTTPAGGGTVTTVSGSGVISVTNGSTTPVVAISMATGTSSGYLSSTDWTTFNNKAAPLGFTPVDKAGDTMTGFLTLSADPTNAMHAATKQWVDYQFTSVTHDLLLAGTLASGRASARELELRDNGANNVWVRAPDSLVGDYTLYMPPNDGAPGEVLKTDGLGSLSWSPAGGGDMMSDGSVLMTGPLQAASGSVGAPGLTFNGNADTGISNPATDEIVISNGGAASVHIDAAGQVNVDRGVFSVRAKSPAAGDGGELKLYGNGGTYALSLHGPDSMPADYDLRFPATQGSNGDVLTNDGSGNLTWQTPSGGGITALTGDIGASGSGSVAATIQPNVVNFSKMQQIQGSRLLGRGVGGTGDVQEIQLGSNLSLSGSTLDVGTTLSNPSGDLTMTPGSGYALHVNQNTSSSAHTNGAVVVDGGVGVGDNLNVNGYIKSNLYVLSNDYYVNHFNGTASGTGIKTSGSMRWWYGADATSESGGDVGSDFTLNRYGDGGGYLDTVLFAKRSSGNVGIGITTPQTKLEVNGTLRIGDGFETCVGGLAGSLRFNSGEIQFCNGTQWTAFALASATLTAANGNNWLPTVTFNGDSDTGLYNPLNDVVGIAAGSVPRVEVTTTDLASTQFGSSSTFSLRRADGTFGLPSSLPTGMTIGATRFQGYDGTNYADGALIGAVTTEAWSPGARGTALSFATTKNGTSAPTERMRIADDGFVGIGTSMPGQDLSIFKTAPSAATVMQVQNTSITGASRVIVSEDGGPLSLESYGTSLNYGNFGSGWVREAGGSSVFWEGSTGPLSIASKMSYMRFYTGGESPSFERMRLTAGGDLAIGTTSSYTKLTVGGGLTMMGSSSGRSSLQAAATGPIITYTLPNSAPPTNGSLLISDTGGNMSWMTNLVEVPQANSVGLGYNVFGAGTPSGDYNTAVGNQTLSSLSTGTNNSVFGAGAGMAITNGSNNTLLGNGAGSNLTVGNGNIIIGSGINAVSAGQSYALNIGNTIYGDLSGKNVGIGTSSPAEALHVYKPAGTARVMVESSGGTNPAETLFKQGSSIATIGYSSTGTGDLTIENQNMSQGIQFNAGSASRMYIKNNGKVGLGTMNPSFDLSFDSMINKLVGVERSGSLSGKNLTVSAGGAAPGASNSNGGSLILQGGVATGNAQSSIEFHTSGGGGSGSTDSSLTPKMIIDGTGVKIGSPANSIKQITAVQVSVGTCPSGPLTGSQTTTCSGSISVPAGMNHSVTCSSPTNVPAIITGQVPNAGGTINVSVLAVGAVTSGQLSALNCVVTSF